MIKKLNELIKKDSLKKGENWTKDIKQFSFINKIIYEKKSKFPDWEKNLEKFRSVK